jgi:hypothetical protein
MIGQKFGRLTVVGISGRDPKRNLWLECQCSCGKKRPFRLDNLRSGKTQSCGCYGEEQRSRGSTRRASERARARYGKHSLPVDEATAYKALAKHGK